MILETEHFIAFIPFFTDYPYGAYIVSKDEKTAITEFSEEEKMELGDMLQELVGGMDLIYDKLFPYMMVMHQRPSDRKDDYNDFYRFHIEFYPPLRASDKIKYNSSSETGGWAAANPTKVEDNAEILRNCIQRYHEKRGNKNGATARRTISKLFSGKYRRGSTFLCARKGQFDWGAHGLQWRLCFPAALSIGTYMAVRKRQDGVYRLKSGNFPQEVTVDANQPIVFYDADDWANYPKGILLQLQKSGISLSGADVLYHGNIPNGAGLSSSASIGMVSAFAFSAVENSEIDMLELAKLCQRMENEFIGVNSGIMDQFAVGFGKRNEAVFLNCQTYEFEMIPLEIEGYKLVITNTNKRRGWPIPSIMSEEANASRGSKSFSSI